MKERERERERKSTTERERERESHQKRATSSTPLEPLNKKLYSDRAP